MKKNKKEGKTISEPEDMPVETSHTEIRGESTKQYSRQTLVFFGGGDAREYPGGLLRLDPAFSYAEPPSS